MKLLKNNKELAFAGFYFDWSLMDPYATISIKAGGIALDENIEVEIQGQKFELELERAGFDEESSFIGVYRAASISEVINTQFPAILGQYKFKDLCQNLGITIDSNFDTQSEYWMLPSMPFKQLLTQLKDLTTPSNKSGMMITSYLDGAFKALCLSDVNTFDPIPIECSVVSNLASNTWTQEFPGKYKVINQTIEESSIDDFTIMDNHGLGVITNFTSSPELQDQRLRFLRNQFWIHYYTSWRMIIQVGGVVDIVPGMLVNPNNMGVSFLVLSVRKRFSNNQLVSSEAVLCRPLK